jgi:CubicO group peptidase (beta-lactamase class C family)
MRYLSAALNRIGKLAGTIAILIGSPSQPAVAQTTLALSAAFDQWVTLNNIPHASMVVTENGGLFAMGVHGGWTIDTIAPIASLSKAITAICIMTLIDANQIAFADTVQKLLPTFTGTIDAAFRPNAGLITVEHLLRHTSGFAVDPVQNQYSTGAADAHPDQWFARQAFNQALANTPGTAYSYSDTNYALLGLIIKTATGETYENYCKRTVLTPRGAVNAIIASGNSAMEAFGGWSISALEYSKFYIRAFDRDSLSDQAKDFMDKAFDSSCTVCNYGLGVLVTPMLHIVHYAPGKVVPLQTYDLLHTGDWKNSGTTPTQFSSVASYWNHGFTAVVITDQFANDGLTGILGALSESSRIATFATSP